ncbi:MAG: STAS domain-containing protein [Phycisphaerales bacterium JB037]
MAEGIPIETTDRDGTRIIAPRGDIDMVGSPTLRGVLHEAHDDRVQRVIVDLEQVGYMDSSGLATLVEAMKLGRSRNASLILCNMGDRVRGIFEIAKLDQYFKITASLDEALAS